MTTQVVSETGILPEAVVYTASNSKGRCVHWTGYITDRRSMRVVWNAGPPTVYGPASDEPNINTADRFAWDNLAGQRLVAAIRRSSSVGKDNGNDGDGGSAELAKAIEVVNSQSKKAPQWLLWLKHKLELASIPIPVKAVIKKNRKAKPRSATTCRSCRKCNVPGCTGFLYFNL